LKKFWSTRKSFTSLQQFKIRPENKTPIHMNKNIIAFCSVAILVCLAATAFAQPVPAPPPTPVPLDGGLSLVVGGCVVAGAKVIGKLKNKA
jgi:hypothetical protein